MSQFVESFATQQLLPPWNATQAHVSGFVIRLDGALIQAYLDTYFNGDYPDAAPFQYRTLPFEQQYGLLSACFYPRVASRLQVPGSHPVSGGRAWDYIRHTEINLSVPVHRYAVNADGLMSDPQLVWVQPAVYSDSDTIVFSSREIWGTDMFLARIERDGACAPDQFHLDAGIVGIKAFDPRSVDQLIAFLHIRAARKEGLDLAGALAANPQLEMVLKGLGLGGMLTGGPPPGAEPGVPPSSMELNNLKQFRDCYDMGRAIYRAIVASKTTYTNVGEIGFYETSGIELAFMWSDSLRGFLERILGLQAPRLDTDAPQSLGPPAEHADDWAGGMDWDMDRVEVKAELGFTLVTDVDFEILETLYTYGRA
jgi:hypothetical protein